MIDDRGGLEACFREIAKADRKHRRQQLRQRTAEALAVLNAARKAGVPITSATFEGVTLKIGEPPKAALTPLEAWKAKRNARQA
jgi:hypothetical protein